MKRKDLLVLLILLVLNSISCLSQKIVRLAENGWVTQTNYSTTIPFRYEGKHIFIDLSINGVTYNFLLDTGADFCIIDTNYVKNADYKNVKKVKVSGSSIDKQKIQLIELKKVSIADIDFNGIGTAIMDLSFINEDHPCSNRPITGVIGASILRKANCQINYKNQEITFSDNLNNLSVPDNAFELKMIDKTWGSPMVNVKINDLNKDFILDTGSSGNLTSGKEFLKELDTINFIGITRENKLRNPYTNYYFQISAIDFGSLLLEDHVISLEEGVASLIGNRFFENFIVTFDWNRKLVFLEPTLELKASPVNDFEVILKPNYFTNKIQIEGIYTRNLAGNNFSIGTEILKINEVDVSGFSKQELCNFWENDWESIRLKNRIILETAQGKIELVKMDLFKDKTM
ncbi:MAG: retropepsin-like aspartic protease [Saprospiraceae bacterium]